MTTSARTSILAILSIALTGGLILGAYWIGALRHAGPKRFFGPADCWVFCDGPLEYCSLASFATMYFSIAGIVILGFVKNKTVACWGYTLALPFACATFLILSAYCGSFLQY